MVDDDDNWFSKRSWRQHRVRPRVEGETVCGGGDVVIVRQVAGARYRVSTRCRCELSDLGEDAAAKLFEIAADKALRARR